MDGKLQTVLPLKRPRFEGQFQAQGPLGGAIEPQALSSTSERKEEILKC